MVKSQRDWPGRAAERGVWVCLFKPCNQVCWVCGEVKQKAVRQNYSFRVYVCSTCVFSFNERDSSKKCLIVVYTPESA